MKEIQNFINGESTPALSGQSMPVFEPATGQVYATLTSSGTADVANAVSAANAAFPKWSGFSAEQRAHYLYRIADEIEQNLEAFAHAESKDTGKPVSVAASIDIPRAVANFRFFAAATTQFSSESHAMGRHAINYTLREPLGVVACISPWNLPLYLLSWKIAPALACGNTVVAKPSEVTPMTAAMLGDICTQAGLPDGVLNIVQGPGAEAGNALVNHPDVKAVSFTGSTETGRHIALATQSQFKKVSLEMGGKNATIVFADCDFEHTVRQVVRSAFSNQGQICLCGSRILIEDSLYERFREAFLKQVASLKAADPEQEAALQGAIVSEAHFKKINNYIDLARSEGGNILCGGPTKVEGRCADGWFINPVVIEDLDNKCRTNQEEIFGPVVTLQPFSGDSEAVAKANDSAYGLACSIWSNDISRCHRVAGQVQTGIVWVNCWMQRDLRTPFGGMKASGVGREGGLEVMRFFTETKNICVEYGEH